MSKNESVTLYFKNSSSDKIYQAQLEASTFFTTGYIVKFQYGRRGSTLTAGKKTKEPIEYEKAKKVFDKLITDKMKKGYSPGESGTPYHNDEFEARTTGILPQLLNPIEEELLHKYLNDDKYCCQEKFDGERGLIKKDNTSVIGINRKGLSKPLSMTLQVTFEEAHRVKSCIIDGEMFGDTIQVFDILAFEGDITDRPYSARLTTLWLIVNELNHESVQLVSTAYTTEEKTKLYNEVKARNGEGVVFKLLTATYEPGRPNSLGTQLKFKFYDECSVIVNTVHDTKRSIGMALLDKETVVPVGNCTIPPNYAIPEVGQIVEVKYLYAYKGGSIYQPQYKGLRTDIDRAECLITQLKYKPE